MEAARGDHGGVPRLLLPADGVGALRRRPDRVARAVEVVRARARAALPGAGVLHRRGDRRVRQPGVGDEVPRRRAPTRSLAYGVASVSGTDPGRLLLHRAAALRRHLPHGRRARPGDGVPLLRPGDQRAGDHPHRAHPRARARRRPRRRRDRASASSSACSCTSSSARRSRPRRRRRRRCPSREAARAAVADRRSSSPRWSAILVFANWGSPDETRALVRRSTPPSGRSRRPAALALGVDPRALVRPRLVEGCGRRRR